MTAQTPTDLTRKGLAVATGCNLETIRYYENISLMPLPRRTANGYRVYGEEDVKRVSFILRLRDLGFSTADTRGLLTLVDGHDYTCHEVHDITVRHIDEVRERIRDLDNILHTLEAMADECSQGEVPECPVIDNLYTVA